MNSKTRTGSNSETVLVLDNGVEIRSSSKTHEAGDYVAITKNGVELGYWDSTEWRDAPIEVMGAILRCAALGGMPRQTKTRKHKRIVAHFQPQAWIAKNAVNIDGAYDFDVTGLIVAMGKEKAFKIEDCSDTSDALWYAWREELGRIKEYPGPRHNGPFAVTVASEIRAYFEGEDDSDD